ncbi:hypothetical protein F0L17_03135 [Streptomyces sp. TRM43335]|uniref:Uncharacterized protein n=1 Tax=Streptomyces taklimakanensis TaxID=2569853 RepID=A0A6G2B7U3_9ACTN|nr:hypothetical protein [Streptomyces taklimakanensis]MTE18139.1 hypothetical protein [Streptomyces taklimakanensis]
MTFVLALVLFAGATVPFTTAVLNPLPVQSWVPDIAVYFSVDEPNWSLACETLFHLLFPLLYRWTARIRPERLWRGRAVSRRSSWRCPPSPAGRSTSCRPPGSWTSCSAW